MRLLSTLLSTITVSLALSASAQIPYYVPNNGLAGWYPFSGNTRDSSGNGNHFTVYGATTLTTDRNGAPNRAYNFSGTSGSQLRTPAVAPTTLNTRNSSFTIAAWFKLSRLTNPGDMQIFWRGDGTFATDQYMLYFQAGVPAFRRDINNGLTSNNVTYPAFIADTVLFHHLAGVYDSLAGTMSIYLDGTSVTQAALPGNGFYNNNGFYNSIGAFETGSTQNFAGKLDDIGLWNRALSGCEISKLYYNDTSFITQQPANASVAAGSTATFSINDRSASGVYQWMIDSNGRGYVNLTNAPPYSGVFSKTLTISNVSTAMNGLSYICKRSGGGCIEYSAERKLSVVPASVQSFEKASGFSIFPNPSSGQFNLASASYRGQATLEILDIVGRRLFREEYSIGAAAIAVDLRNTLIPGRYTLKLSTQDKAYSTQIIIQ